MKKYIKKPVVWLVAAVVVGGGLTPVWAENGTMSKLLASDISATTDGAGLSGVEQVTDANGNYIKANVRDDITKVIILLPNDSKSEIVSFPNHGLKVAIPASASKDGQTATLLAYVNTELVDTVKIKLADGTVSDDELVYANALYDQTARQMKVSGIVNPKVDKVVVRYGSESKEAKLVHVWEGAKSFEYGFAVNEAKDANVVIELYTGDEKLSEQSVKVNKVNVPAETVKPTGMIEGTATLSANKKQFELKGTVTYKNGEKKGEWKLVVTGPDGKKHEIKVGDNGKFETKLPFKNRSYSAKAIHVELFYGKTLVAKSDISHGTPVNQAPDQKKQKNQDEQNKVVHVDKKELEKKKEEMEKNKEKLKEYLEAVKKNAEKQREKGHKENEHKKGDHDDDEDED
ncbi:UNVERIFIED_CONTAM: hypothetical protein ABID98_000681 [Brevibacillus sp. OAP136]